LSHADGGCSVDAVRQAGRILALVGLVVTAVSCGSGSSNSPVIPHNAQRSQARNGLVPFVVPIPQRTPERDDPAVVQGLLVKEQQAALARAQAASKLDPTRAAGCVPVADPSGRTLLGPLAPRVRARIIGHQVEVIYRFGLLPTSDACRPAIVTVVVHSSNSTAPSGSPVPSVGDYLLAGPVGRLTLDLPWYTRAPFDLIVDSSTVLGHRSTSVKRKLACPQAGCLNGYSPPPHSLPLPRPVLPLIGLARAELEASLGYVVSRERWPSARSARCSSLRSCTVTQVTPGFPTQPYRVRYRIAGQQLPGCWMGLNQGPIDALPYPDAGRGPLELSGCRVWLG
jgi:hypothetical protein